MTDARSTENTQGESKGVAQVEPKGAAHDATTDVKKVSAEFQKNLTDGLARLRATFKSGKTRSYDWRMGQLSALKRLLDENDEAINAALWKDLHKSPFECTVTEQGVVRGEIEDALKNLRSWMKTETMMAPLIDQPGSCEIRHDPLGVTLIIGAWNFPINLLLAPLVGAISGGNAAILKPSEMSVAVSHVIAELVPKYLDQDAFLVLEGAVAETDLILDQHFDLIFFTGSGPVGKIVMGKAAQHLTPVVLELGGKSPTLICKDANLKVAAKRVAWGKFMNSGQTCIAPDYVIIDASVEEQFVDLLTKAIFEIYGKDPKQSPDYGRIVNAKNYDRLLSLLKDGEVVTGGVSDSSERYIAPTILVNVSAESKVMQEEIFGPILPVLPMVDLDAMIEFVNSRDKPLALYVFSEDRAKQERVLCETTAGGAAVNDVVMHMPIAGLPFGGVGPSGMGSYHGKYSFGTFTHAKGVLKKSTWIDVPLRYAPYTKASQDWVKRLM